MKRASRSRVLVIDASVLHAAGGEHATHPIAMRSREMLKAVLRVCHCVVLTPRIGQEWNEHMSRFARTWRVAMEARKKVKRLPDHESAELGAALRRWSETGAARKALEKDRHLVEAALACDKTVVSADTRCLPSLTGFRPPRHPT